LEFDPPVVGECCELELAAASVVETVVERGAETVEEKDAHFDGTGPCSTVPQTLTFVMERTES
jgi:hypothetical protein